MAPHPNDDDVRRTTGDKLENYTGHRGETPNDRAARIAGVKVTAAAQGDGASAPEEVFTAAPARQISNYGNVKGK